jgi:glycosyltransferase involved in cell wall biosynthesis
MPMAVLEAMACRCPVILSDIPAHREIADGADFIPLVEADDVVGLAREVARFNGMSGAARAELGERCRSLVEQRFSLAAMQGRYEDLYLEVLGKRQRTSEDTQS